MRNHFVVVLGLILAASFAPADDTSEFSNVVGFQKIIARTGGMVMASTPFNRSPATLDNVIGRQLTGGKSQSGSDNVLLWNALEQKYEYYWINNRAGSNWFSGGDIPAPATNFVTTDLGFWLDNNKTTASLVIASGDVVENGSVTNRLLPGYNLVSYPFSQAVDINACGLTNGAAGKSESGSDRILVWDEAAWMYQRYWLRKVDRRWLTGGATPTLSTGVMVGGGRGFWYERNTNTVFAWIEPRPYILP